MDPTFAEGNVRAHCPDCNAITTFEFKKNDGAEYGSIYVGIGGSVFYKLLRCAGCGRGGVAKAIGTTQYLSCKMEWFWPLSRVREKPPAGTPQGIAAEYKEAQGCMAASAWRAAAALLRSTLEKVLVANGYAEPNLYKKIEAAAADGVITSARRQRAQELIRTLGNDVLHDEWRVVTPAETDLACHYVGRVLEDFYDDRTSVEAVLREKNRLPQAPAS